jgi:fido (protein-threonine AMPylation protein)
MMTLRQFGAAHAGGTLRVPASTAWYISELAEARGREELFTRQSPQRLRALRESAIVESAVSSNRIEGVEIEPARVGPVVLGTSRLRDRDEEEVRGYRDALRLVHEGASGMELSEATVRELHARSRGRLGDAGRYRAVDSDIIERYPDGRSRVRFRPVAHADIAPAMRELMAEWHRCERERWMPPAAALAAFNLDFLCVHPFRDGNGRASRLLMLLQCYQAGFGVGRYISLERLIEENKPRYYETLEQASREWHAGRHDPWPYVDYVLYILMSAYREFESRVGQTRVPRGAKTDQVAAAIRRLPEPFRVADVQRACPGVSLDLIRRVLKQEQKGGRVECLGRGPAATWRRRDPGR